MCKVNYVAEHQAFMRYAIDFCLGKDERLLWNALFMLANRRASYDSHTGAYDWPEDFFIVSNSEVMLNSCLNERALLNARNDLKQKGLIDFIKGERNKRNPKYKINYLTCIVTSENAGNNGGNHVGNDVGNNAGNNTPSAPQGRPPYININNGLGSNTGINPSQNQENPLDSTDENEYYSNVGTREFLSAADNRYLNQYRTPTVIRYKHELNLPNGNWIFSERARMATAQHVVDAIIAHGKFWSRDRRQTSGLYDLILHVLNDGRISPLSIYILAMETYSWDSFRSSLMALNGGYYEFKTQERGAE